MEVSQEVILSLIKVLGGCMRLRAYMLALPSQGRLLFGYVPPTDFWAPSPYISANSTQMVVKL